MKIPQISFNVNGYSVSVTPGQTIQIPGGWVTVPHDIQNIESEYLFESDEDLDNACLIWALEDGAFFKLYINA